MSWRKTVSVLLVVFFAVMLMGALGAPVLAQDNGDEPEPEPTPEPEPEPIIDEEVSPNVIVRNLQITPVYAQSGQAVTISADVANEGQSWESPTLNLYINGGVEQYTQVGVSPGTVSPVSFTVYRESAGQYSVALGDASGWFDVLSDSKATAPASPFAGSTGLDTTGIIATTVIGVMLVAGLIVAFRMS